MIHMLGPDTRICDSPIHISVEAVIVRDQFILPLVIELAFEVHMLEDGQIGLVARQADWGDVHLALTGVVLKHLGHIGVHLEIVEKDLVSPKSI